MSLYTVFAGNGSYSVTLKMCLIDMTGSGYEADIIRNDMKSDGLYRNCDAAHT